MGQLPPSFGSHAALSALGWADRLNHASAVEEIINVVKDYLAQWTPEELANLPEACRPGRIADSDDITLCAFALVREQFKAEDRDDAALARMATFFTGASRRLSQILAPKGVTYSPSAPSR